MRVSPPRSYTAQFSASCNELKAVLTTKDISGQFLAPFAEVAVNTFSVVYTDFVTSTQMSNIFRDEASKGAQTATSSSKAGGLGINIGGHFGSKSSASTGVITTKDTRTRSISANLLDDASAEFAKNVRMETWIEFGNANVTRDKVAEELLKFIFANSVPIDAQIKRIDAGNWSLIAGTESRSLTNDELQQVLEGVSKQKLDFSEKAEGEFKGFKGGADKKYAGSDDNNIKWKMEGAAWVPTNLRLYAVSSDRVSQSARAQVVDVLVKNKGMLAAPLEPVADHYLPNQDLIEIIKAQIGQAELQLKALINKTLLNVHNYDEAGVDGIDATAGVTGSRCLPGSFHYDMHTYKEGGNVKIGIRCRKFKAPQIP